MLPDVLTVDCIAAVTVLGQELIASKKVFYYIILLLIFWTSMKIYRHVLGPL